jgi:hypothetical protein
MEGNYMETKVTMIDFTLSQQTRLSSDKKTVHIRLPRELWREAGLCDCQHCKGAVGYWDTLAVDTTKNGYAWTVHYPVFGQ